ncbi:MAG: hypothetical protein WCJ31_16855 [Planctomycetia bacterium]
MPKRLDGVCVAVVGNDGARAWRGSGPPPAASPDVRFGLPGLRSLHAACASPSVAPLAGKAVATAGGGPS